MECNEQGLVKGIPYFHQCISGGPDTPVQNSIQTFAMDTAVQTAIQTASASTSNANSLKELVRPSKRLKRGNTDPPKLIPSGNLFDAERSQLHIEIYEYFSWLKSQLLEIETSAGGWRRVQRAGITVAGIQNLMTKMEGTFRNVGEFKGRQDVITDDDDDKDNENDGNDEEPPKSDGEKENATPRPLPLLEECLERDLKREVDLRRFIEEANNKTGTPASSESEKHDFDDMFARLVAFKEERGDFMVHPNYKDRQAVCLGQWVQRLRERKKKLRESRLESERPVERDLVSFTVSPGMLGLSLKFYESNVGALVTAIDP